MNISETFIHRPIATSLLMAGVALFGIIAYESLSVSDLPQVDYPTITVSASLPGANPDTMASAVATPLERQFTTIAGLDSMISNSGQGSSNITLQFSLSRDIDGATVDVETAIAEAMPLLPPGMPTPPSFRKVNPGDQPIISLFLTSPTMRLSDLDEYAETMLAQRISMVEGVAQVQVYGSAKYAVRIQVDPNELATRGIGLNEIDQALRDWNVNVPTGTLYGPHTAYNVQVNGQLMRARNYNSMVVAYRNGAPVRLGDVAHVIDSVEDDKQFSKIYGGEFGKEGTKGVSLAVMRQPGSNTIEVTDNIKRLLPVFQTQIPPTVHLGIRGDRSKNIREAFQDIQFTMAATLILVVLVIFLFLRNFSATMIPAMALPFSIVGTFAVMKLLNFSLNNISMMALILSIGFVVDDAIVMLENIVRHIEMGETPMQAALHGSREIGFTIVSMTLSLAAVFIPILFMAGILGRLFREFAVTICAAILISGLVSISLTPMLCSRFLRAGKETAHGLFYRMMEGLFDFTLHVYRVSLHWVLRHRPVMLGLFVAVLGVTGYFYVIVQKGFIPDTDNDNYSVTVEAAQGTSYYQMVKYQELVSSIVVQDPDVESFYSTTGGSNFGPSRCHRPRDGQPAPAPPAQGYRGRHRPAHPPQTFRHSRPARLHLHSRRHPRRRTHVQERLRLHPLRPRYRATLRGSSQARTPHRAPARLAGSHQRSANQDPARQHRAGPRPRRRPESQLEHRLQHALRRLRPPVLFHHLLAHQSVPRAARNAAALPGAHRRARPGLHEERRPAPWFPCAPWPNWFPTPARRASRTPASCPPSPFPSRSSPACRWARPLRRSKRPPKLFRPPSPAHSRAPPRFSRIPCRTWASC